MRTFLRIGPLTVVLPLFLAACQEIPGPELADPIPSPAISDGAHNGRDGFYFLPPLVPDPVTTGTFDPAFLPFLRVAICEWDGSRCVGNPIAEFTSKSGSGSEVLRVDLEKEHYIANWHTDESGLDPTKTYRIRVMAGRAELGYADVDVVSGGKELKNVDTDEFVALKDGRTLPIKFRFEGDQPDVRIIDGDGGVAQSRDGIVLVSIPPGAVSSLAILTIAPALQAPAGQPGAYLTAVGPFDISLSGELRIPATVTMRTNVADLHHPEVWAFRDGSWQFHPATDIGDDFITIESTEFSTFEIWESIRLGGQDAANLLSFSDVWTRGGDHGFNLDDCQGWVANENVTVHDYSASIQIRPGTPADIDSACDAVPGYGGELSTIRQFGLGLFSARVLLSPTEGTRYSLFMFNRLLGPNQNPDDEATIEIDFVNTEWHLNLVVFRRDRYGAASSARKRVYWCRVPISREIGDRWLTLGIRRMDDRIDALLNGELAASTGRDCTFKIRRGDQEVDTTATATMTLPRGMMNLLVNAWAPKELGKFVDPATYRIAWSAASAQPLSDVVVSVTTGGPFQDPDGYQVVLDGAEPIPASAFDIQFINDRSPVVFQQLFGVRTFELVSLSPNCQALGENPRDVSVPAGVTLQLVFEISCSPRGLGGEWGLYFDRKADGILGTAPSSFNAMEIAVDSDTSFTAVLTDIASGDNIAGEIRTVGDRSIVLMWGPGNRTSANYFHVNLGRVNQDGTLEGGFVDVARQFGDWVMVRPGETVLRSPDAEVRNLPTGYRASGAGELAGEWVLRFDRDFDGNLASVTETKRMRFNSLDNIQFGGELSEGGTGTLSGRLLTATARDNSVMVLMLTEPGNFTGLAGSMTGPNELVGVWYDALGSAGDFLLSRETPNPRVLLAEDFSGALSRWTLHGSPTSFITSSEGNPEPSLNVNGDPNFDSGIESVRLFGFDDIAANDGLTFVAEYLRPPEFPPVNPWRGAGLFIGRVNDERNRTPGVVYLSAGILTNGGTDGNTQICFNHSCFVAGIFQTDRGWKEMRIVIRTDLVVEIYLEGQLLFVSPGPVSLPLDGGRAPVSISGRGGWMDNVRVLGGVVRPDAPGGQMARISR